MQNITMTPVLESAKLVARNEDEKVIRRVQFKLTSVFSHEHAEWLGCTELYQKLIKLDMLGFGLDIGAVVAQATFSGSAGNAEAQVFGVKAKASIKLVEDTAVTKLSLEFEAFPEAKLLTWIAASMKEHIEVELKASQLEIAAS